MTATNSLQSIFNSQIAGNPNPIIKCTSNAGSPTLKHPTPLSWGIHQPASCGKAITAQQRPQQSVLPAPAPHLISKQSFFQQVQGKTKEEFHVSN